RWSESIFAVAFWCTNLGLAASALFSALPLGLMQAWASVEYGYAFARSPELLNQPTMLALRWMRIPGDTLLAIGLVSTALIIMGVGRDLPRPARGQRARRPP